MYVSLRNRIDFNKKGNKYTLAVNDAKIEIDAAGNLLFRTTGQIKAPRELGGPRRRRTHPLLHWHFPP